MKGVMVSFFYTGNDWRPSNVFPVQPYYDNSLIQGVIPGQKLEVNLFLSEN